MRELVRRLHDIALRLHPSELLPELLAYVLERVVLLDEIAFSTSASSTLACLSDLSVSVDGPSSCSPTSDGRSTWLVDGFGSLSEATFRFSSQFIRWPSAVCGSHPTPCPSVARGLVLSPSVFLSTDSLSFAANTPSTTAVFALTVTSSSLVSGISCMSHSLLEPCSSDTMAIQLPKISSSSMAFAASVTFVRRWPTPSQFQ